MARANSNSVRMRRIATNERRAPGSSSVPDRARGGGAKAATWEPGRNAWNLFRRWIMMILCTRSLNAILRAPTERDRKRPCYVGLQRMTVTPEARPAQSRTAASHPREADPRLHKLSSCARLRHDESKREWREQKAALRFLASQRASRIAALEAELAAARKCPAVAITITPVAGAPAEASSGRAAWPGAEHMLDLCARNAPGEPGDAFSGEMVAQHVRSAVLVAHEITAMRCTAKQGSRRFYPLTRRQAGQRRL